MFHCGANLSVKAAAPYLGVVLGPAAAASQWRAASAKWQRRALTIASGQLAPSLGVPLYNSRAVSVLQYLAQVLAIPSSIWKHESNLVHKVLHFPPNVANWDGRFRIREFGGPHIVSCRVLGKASLARTAARTVQGWESWISKMKCVALGCLPVTFSVREQWWPDVWDHPSLASNLSNARAGKLLAQEKRQELGSILSVSDPEVRLHKSLYGFLLPQLLPRSLSLLCARRASRVLGTPEVSAKQIPWDVWLRFAFALGQWTGLLFANNPQWMVHDYAYA